MIFLKILKIIGIILLILILLVLLLLALLLFVPVKYQVDFSKDDDLKVKGKATWLFHFLNVRFLYNKESGFRLRIKLLWFKIFGSDSKPKQAKRTKEKEEIAKEAKEEIKEDAASLKETESVEDDDSMIASKEFYQLDSEDIFPKEDKKKSKEKKASFIFRIKNKLRYFWTKIKSGYQLITEEKNKRAFMFILNKLKKVLKHIMPKKLYLKAKYSLGSPDKTAILLGVIAMFPIGYQNRWNILPDFEDENTYFKGKGDIGGKIRLCSILFPALSIILNKDCRQLWKSIKN